jgi:SAM-dependent methyltransferase
VIDDFFRKLRTARRLGLLPSARLEMERVFLRVLRHIFKFHPWHAEATKSARAYRQTAARIVDGLNPDTVVEIGSGLGYILARIAAPHRFGFDVDKGVVRAARLLNGRSISFVHGSFSSVTLPSMDVLILINWIHEVSPKTLEESLKPLLPRTRFLLVDAIDPDGDRGYRFKHDFAFLDSCTRKLSVTHPPGEGRSFHLYEVNTGHLP